VNRVAAYLTTIFAAFGDRFADRKDRGATAVEYGLLVGLIAVAIIATLVILGPQLNGLFEMVTDGITGATTPAPVTTP
jgi:pilus assembly protein Flp/PilA